MRICIVGNGPSAKGHGAEIDDCDFVVRLKAYWHHSALDTGSKTNAIAWFGSQRNLWWETTIQPVEHWRTWSDRQYDEALPAWKKAREFFHYTAFGLPVMVLDYAHWRHAANYLDRFPSTGFIAVMMAIARWPECNLLLTGYDSTIEGRPDYYDARNPNPDAPHPHDVLTEKRAMAKLLKSEWLGDPCGVKLEWLHMPELGGDHV